MRKSLADWVRDADAARQIEEFQVEQRALDFSYVRDRSADYYTALVAELYSRLRDNYEDPADWARLGNALSQFADKDREASLKSNGVSGAEANLYAAAAFYFGGFPASAYIVLKSRDIDIAGQYWNACYHLLSKSLGPNDGPVRSLHGALRRGDYPFIQRFDRELALREEAAFDLGPDEWVQLRLYRSLFNRFSTSNVRAVLPDGYSDFWTPLIHSLLSRPVPNWEFFPSQIEAIRAGILTENQTYSLQMPTGAGKTALAETLIFAQLRSNPSGAAILLVPFRSIAAELKKGLVRNLNGMGVATGCFYGGTVPSGEEVRSLDSIRAVVATPEALSALLSAAPQFLAKVSLVLCDEGHLLDSGSRGVGLEILMSRLKARLGTPPKFVFISAIVPNIEEINSWLNGSPASVVKSNYRPSIAEFSVLMPASNFLFRGS